MWHRTLFKNRVSPVCISNNDGLIDAFHAFHDRAHELPPVQILRICLTEK